MSAQFQQTVQQYQELDDEEKQRQDKQDAEFRQALEDKFPELKAWPQKEQQ
jgi:hypothetical protein